MAPGFDHLFSPSLCPDKEVRKRKNPQALAQRGLEAAKGNRQGNGMEQIWLPTQDPISIGRRAGVRSGGPEKQTTLVRQGAAGIYSECLRWAKYDCLRRIPVCKDCGSRRIPHDGGEGLGKSSPRGEESNTKVHVAC